MRIDRLDLKAFGCFTGVSLDLAGPSQGMFLIHGLNEAGKSTALEGIRQWLYGIDRNVPLDFRHKKPKQRVGGTVSAGEQRLCCFRKRGNAGTLLDEHDRSIDDDALRPFLQGIDENRFRMTFGINHARLREGGRDIVEGKGDLGQALFSAGSGLLRLNKMEKKLEEETCTIFAVRGETPEINRGLSRCREIEVRAVGERLTLGDYEQKVKALSEVTAKREELRSKLAELSRKQGDVDRLIRVIPLVRRREALLGRSSSLASVARLRDNFRDEFRKLESDLLMEQAALDGLEDSLDETEAACRQIAADPDILGEKDTLLQLSKRAATYETDYSDRNRLITERNQIQGEAKQILRKLGREPNLDPELIEPLRLDNHKRNRIRELGVLGAGRATRASTARERLVELDARADALEEQSGTGETPVDTEGLAATLNRILRLGDLEGDCARLAGELAEYDRGLGGARSRTTLWCGSIDHIARVPVPLATDIEFHRSVIDTAARNLEDARRRREQQSEYLVEAGRQLDRLRHAGDVPSEQDLLAQRSRRDQGWRLIRSAWRDGVPDEVAEREWVAAVAPGASLPEAYQASVGLTDQTADRLRREAQRVSEYAGLVADQSAGRARLQSAEGDVQRAETALAEAEGRWKAIWEPAGITPRSPTEMRAWLDQWQQLLQAARARQEAFTRWGSKNGDLDSATGALRAALEASGGLPASLRPEASLGELGAVASRRIEAMAEARARRTRLKEDAKSARQQRERAKVEATEAETIQKNWQEEWDAATRFLGRLQRLSPDEANRDLDDVMEFWKKLSDLKNRQARIEGIESRSGSFPGAVSEVAQRLGDKGPGNEDPLRTYERLQGRLQAAESAQASLNDKENHCAQLRNSIREKEGRLEALRQRLQRLCQEAGVASPDQLPAAIRDSDELREVEARLTECEADLQVQGGMADYESLLQVIRQGEETGRDYERERAGLRAELETGQASLQSLNEGIGAADEALKTLRARSGAGNSAAELESEYGRLRRLAEEYVALSLASRVLIEAVRRYREGNSSGLLSEASGVFRLLTNQSFDRLAISEDDDGRTYLVGVRPDESEVEVEGMSDGTCDQLYLSLRLAHLKRHAVKDGPFPFIVDDILLTFDDKRARAALHCLSDLGQSMQVLYFTHHRHIRDMAADAEFAGKIWIRDIL